MDKKFDFWSIIIALVLCAFATEVSKGEGVPESLTLVYFEDGRTMECDMGWIEGDTLKCRKYGGTIAFSLETVDLEKTCRSSIESEKENILTESKIDSLYDAILVQGFRVIKGREELGRTSYLRNKIFHEVSCTVKNLGDPCIVIVECIASTKDGYELKSARLTTKSRLLNGESAILREKVMVCDTEDKRITEWKIDKIRSSGRLPRPKPNKYSNLMPRESSVPVRKTSRIPERSRVLNELNSRELQDLSIIICKYGKKCNCRPIYGQMTSISKSSHDMFFVQCSDGRIFCIHRLPEPPFWVVIQADPNGNFSECVIRTPDSLPTRNKK